MRTRFTDLVGCTAPIQQAPMGAVSGPDLAVAVAEAGGLGTITAFGMPNEVLMDRLDEMGGRTSGALGVNFLTAKYTDPDVVRAAAARVRVVDFFWMPPDPSLVEAAHESGALVCWQVGSAVDAAAAVDAGCDLVAAQGTEAGGHVWGETPLLPLLQSVLDAVDAPVLAAGGISTARGLAAVLAAGAAGARVGTRFIATTESSAHPAYVDAVLAATAAETAVTDRFNVCPLCAVQPRHRALTAAIDALAATTADPVGTLRGQAVPRASGAPPVTGAEGDVSAMAMYCGQGVGAVTDVAPAGDIVRRMTEGAEHLMRSALS